MNISDWLAFIERQHAKPVDLGLDRVRQVSQALGQRQTCPVILVGGTNGKGSTCAMLERILLCAGWRVGLYTSPHLISYNERVRVDGRPVDDAALCEGFARVEAARGGTPLTYFEFGTLAAWEAFAAHPLDAIILEVGLGGRLDATNLFEPDVSIVTSIDFDHMDYLGATREEIGFEKAGIFRSLRPAVCGDADPPQSLLEHTWSIGADLQVIGEDFGHDRQAAQWSQWSYWGRSGRRNELDLPALRGECQLSNAACALTALDLLWRRLPVTLGDICRGLAEVELPGRFQVVPGQVVLDVAHNPQAARVLAGNLGDATGGSRTWAVFGMLRDKDIAGVVRAVRHRIDRWLPCNLPGARAASTGDLAAILAAEGVAGPFPVFESPAAALAHARENAGGGDRIVAFGSFLTVAGVYGAIQPNA